MHELQMKNFQQLKYSDSFVQLHKLVLYTLHPNHPKREVWKNLCPEDNKLFKIDGQ